MTRGFQRLSTTSESSVSQFEVGVSLSFMLLLLLVPLERGQLFKSICTLQSPFVCPVCHGTQTVICHWLLCKYPHSTAGPSVIWTVQHYHFWSYSWFFLLGPWFCSAAYDKSSLVSVVFCKLLLSSELASACHKSHVKSFSLCLAARLLWSVFNRWVLTFLCCTLQAFERSLYCIC